MAIVFADTAWVLISSALVLFMLPGLALFLDQAHTEQTIQVREELLNFVREESSKAKPGRSTFGKQ